MFVRNFIFIFKNPIYNSRPFLFLSINRLERKKYVRKLGNHLVQDGMTRKG